MQYEAIDIVFAVLVVILSIRAGIRGFVKELLGTAAVFLAIGAAVVFSGFAALLVEQLIGPTVWTQVIAFLIVFLLVYLLVKLFESALNKLIERIHLDQLDHALGFFLGIVEGLLLSFILILLIQIQPFVDPQSLLGESLFARLLLPLLPFAADFLRTGRSNV